MSIYDEMQSVARDVLAEFDQGGIFYIHNQAGAGPSDAPGPSTETPYKVDGAARGVKFKYVDGTNILATDLQVTISVKPDVPTPNMRGFVQADGKRYKLTGLKQIPPVGVPIVHVLIFRK